jgi:hypothetical protein
MTERSTRQQQRYNPSTSIALESFLVDVVPEVHYKVAVTRTTNICDECYAVLFRHETQNICCINGHGIINFIFTTYIHTAIHIYIHNLILHFSRIMHNSMFDYSSRKHFNPFYNKWKSNMMHHPVLMLMQYSHPRTIWQIQH